MGGGEKARGWVRRGERDRAEGVCGAVANEESVSFGWWITDTETLISQFPPASLFNYYADWAADSCATSLFLFLSFAHKHIFISMRFLPETS